MATMNDPTTTGAGASASATPSGSAAATPNTGATAGPGGAAAGTGAAGASATTAGSTTATTLQPTDKVFVTELAPNNNSGAHGIAAFVLHGNTLTAEVVAEGLEANQVQAMHIHGFSSTSSSTGGTASTAGGTTSAAGGQTVHFPTLADDTKPTDGFVSAQEAVQNAIGPVQLALTKSGAISTDISGTPVSGSTTTTTSGSDFVTSGADGTIKFHQTYTFNSADTAQAAALSALGNLGHDAVMIHGETVPSAIASADMSSSAGTSGSAMSPSGGSSASSGSSSGPTAMLTAAQTAAGPSGASSTTSATSTPATGSPGGTFDPTMPVATGLLHEVTGTALGNQIGGAVLASDSATLDAVVHVDAFALGHA